MIPVGPCLAHAVAEKLAVAVFDRVPLSLFGGQERVLRAGRDHAVPQCKHIALPERPAVSNLLILLLIWLRGQDLNL